jgi:hypothetical protein
MTEPDDTEYSTDWLDAVAMILFVIIIALALLSLIGMAARV